MDQHGFYLFVDEAGDTGTDRVRPIDANGSSEWFVLAGVLISSGRLGLLDQLVANAASISGKRHGEVVHFRDVSQEIKYSIIQRVCKERFGLIVIASNKRNMRRYRNLRVERRLFEVRKGRTEPARLGWFYNNCLRYLLERATIECARWSHKLHQKPLPIKVILSERTHNFSQLKAWLLEQSIRRHRSGYFNNKRTIYWPMLDIKAIENARPRRYSGLQVADWMASACYGALDETQFGFVEPKFMRAIAPRFIRDQAGLCFDYGFKLLPDGFKGPLSERQIESLACVGWHQTNNGASVGMRTAGLCTDWQIVA
jgi:hypothetical protein